MRRHRDCTWLMLDISQRLSVDVLAHICALISQAKLAYLSFFKFIEADGNI